MSPKLEASTGLREAFTKGRFLMTLGQPPHMVLRSLLAYWESGQGEKNHFNEAKHKAKIYTLDKCSTHTHITLHQSHHNTPQHTTTHKMKMSILSGEEQGPGTSPIVFCFCGGSQ